MRIQRRKQKSDGTGEYRSRLKKAASATGIKGRVCGASCSVRCPQCGSTACQCLCTPSCPDAPRALSSEPECFPIEPGIVPLVFEMKRLGMFSPCWSCEGHSHPGGSLAKPPRVWFYSNAMVQVRLFANGLADLKFAKQLNVSWNIVVTYSDPDNPDTAFSVEPILAADSKIALRELQADAATIARSLQAMMNGEAKKLLEAVPRS